MRLDIWPRSVMVENRQRLVHNVEDFNELVDTWNGRTSVFISANAYPYGGNLSIKTLSKVLIIQIYVDFDDKRKPEHTISDVRKLHKWVEEEGHKWTADFSGGKGFKFCIWLRPAVYNINDPVLIDSDTSVPWREYYKAIYVFLQNTLGLRTMDMNVAEPKRVMRVWNTDHFFRNNTEPTGTKCVPIDAGMIHHWTWSQFVEYAQHPRSLEPTWNDEPHRLNITFDEFIDKYQIDPDIISIEGDVEGVLIAPQFKPMVQNDWWTYLNQLIPDYPCIPNEMFSEDEPKHIARFAMAVYLKLKGQTTGIRFDHNWFENFYKSMQYVDYESGAQDRHDNLVSIIDRGQGSTRPYLDPYKMPGCRRLYAGRICMGGICPKFRRYMPGIAKSMGEGQLSSPTTLPLPVLQSHDPVPGLLPPYIFQMPPLQKGSIDWLPVPEVQQTIETTVAGSDGTDPEVGPVQIFTLPAPESQPPVGTLRGKSGTSREGSP